MTEQLKDQPPQATLQRMNKALVDMTMVAKNAGITGDEYILILQTMVAQVLAENEKKLEHRFRENLRKDTLARRLRILRSKEHVQAPLANPNVKPETNDDFVDAPTMEGNTDVN